MMRAKDTNGLGPAILVMVGQPVVAQDIALTIADEMPQAQVLLAGSMAAGMQMILPYPTIAIALIEADEAGFDGTELQVALAAKGARICLIGGRSGQRWATLPVPFSTDDLLAALKIPTPPPDGGGVALSESTE